MILKFQKKLSDYEFSGCYDLSFKQGLRQLSHVVTVQSLYPFESTQENLSPIVYFEVKTIRIEDKEIK